MKKSMSEADSLMHIFQFGESAIRIEFGKGIDPDINRKVKAVSDHIERNSFPGMLECVPTFSSVTVFYDLMKVKSLASLQDKDEPAYKIVSFLVEEIISKMGDSADNQARIVEIPVCYGGNYGPDLEYVAEHNKLTINEVIDIHTSSEYLVYMIGFAPGFPYLGGMSERIATPRRSSPRITIPAGSVGIAGMQTGVYPIVTPGGWQLIGRTPFALFHPDENPPSLLQAGDIVKFRAISPEQFQAYKEGRS